MGKKDQNLVSGRNRYRIVPRVLVFLRNSSDVLMLKGAADKRIWADLYNGVGGHVEKGEDILAAARREVKEETGLDIPALRLVALANIDAGEADLGIMMFVFVGWSEERRLKESEEGKLCWLPLDKLEEHHLVEDLYWLMPRIVSLPADSQPLFLHYSYGEEDQLLILESKKPDQLEARELSKIAANKV
jgi:8-oxo-dGTP diphosphatase